MKETINAQFIAFKTRCVAFFNEELKPLGYTDYSCDDLTQSFVGNATPFFNFAVSRICPRTGRNIWALFMDYCPTDKNGKEIYEGDIVVYGSHCKHIVEFKHGMFGYTLMDGWFVGYGGNSNFTFNPLDKSNEHEIIGNIHDNPELLNEK